uniref:Gag-like protein n=1 Tax=Romanomermis culicivorax TaxID=13658 RepID=A0A915HTP1_ROMCU
MNPEQSRIIDNQDEKTQPGAKRRKTDDGNPTSAKPLSTDEANQAASALKNLMSKLLQAKNTTTTENVQKNVAENADGIYIDVGKMVDEKVAVGAKIFSVDEAGKAASASTNLTFKLEKLRQELTSTLEFLETVKKTPDDGLNLENSIVEIPILQIDSNSLISNLEEKLRQCLGENLTRSLCIGFPVAFGVQLSQENQDLKMENSKLRREILNLKQNLAKKNRQTKEISKKNRSKELPKAPDASPRPSAAHLQMCSFHGRCTHSDADCRAQRPNSAVLVSNAAPTANTSRCYFCRTRAHATNQCDRHCPHCHQIRLHRANACPHRIPPANLDESDEVAWSDNEKD